VPICAHLSIRRQANGTDTDVRSPLAQGAATPVSSPPVLLAEETSSEVKLPYCAEYLMMNGEDRLLHSPCSARWLLYMTC